MLKLKDNLSNIMIYALSFVFELSLIQVLHAYSSSSLASIFLAVREKKRRGKSLTSLSFAVCNIPSLLYIAVPTTTQGKSRENQPSQLAKQSWQLLYIFEEKIIREL